jgi:O-antigen ligase
VFIRIIYLIVFYFFASGILKREGDVRKVIWIYTSALLVVIIFATLKHAQYGFTPEINHWPPKPFFKDHTIYGAAIAMLLPFFLLHLFGKKGSIPDKGIKLVVASILLAGAFLSYSRAVWLSVLMVILLYPLLLLNIKFKHLQLVFLGFIILFWVFRTPILFNLQEIDSQRADLDLKEHVSSSANIESSTSNRERINRWASAFKMIREKPFLGFGPGTYQFQYGPYQEEEHMTHLSTYFGDMGGVHSEYLKPWVESGFVGLFTFLLVVYFTLITLFRLYGNAENKRERLIVASLLLGLTSYFIHGLVNFFSSTDKIAMLFWGFTAYAATRDTLLKTRT